MGLGKFASGGRSRGIVPTAPRCAQEAPQLVERFGLSGLRIMLWLGMSFAILGLVIALVEGAEAVQVAFGGATAAAWIWSLIRFDIASRFLRRTGRIHGVVAVFSAGQALAGTWNSPFTDELYVLMGVAAVVATRRGVAACVGVAYAGYFADLFADGFGAGQFVDSRHASQIANNLGNLALFALVLLIAFGASRRVLGSAREIVESVRDGGPALTPELGAAIRRADGAPAGWLPRARATDVVAVLNARERALLAQLATGLMPKQVAQQSGTPLGTIRSQIASAKRKTGARTVEQLVGLVAEADHTG